MAKITTKFQLVDELEKVLNMVAILMDKLQQIVVGLFSLQRWFPEINGNIIKCNLFL
jgi:hypothetical protein